VRGIRFSIELILIVGMETPGKKFKTENSRNGGAWSFQKSNPIISGFHNRPIPIEINLS
jgi:hypothetical protein